jgi:hypothetical protein
MIKNYEERLKEVEIAIHNSEACSLPDDSVEWLEYAKKHLKRLLAEIIQVQFEKSIED